MLELACLNTVRINPGMNWRFSNKTTRWILPEELSEIALDNGKEQFRLVRFRVSGVKLFDDNSAVTLNPEFLFDNLNVAPMQKCSGRDRQIYPENLVVFQSQS